MIKTIKMSLTCLEENIFKVFNIDDKTDDELTQITIKDTIGGENISAFRDIFNHEFIFCLSELCGTKIELLHVMDDSTSVYMGRDNRICMTHIYESDDYYIVFNIESEYDSEEGGEIQQCYNNTKELLESLIIIEKDDDIENQIINIYREYNCDNSFVEARQYFIVMAKDNISKASVMFRKYAEVYVPRK